ncbi:hypothetical protein Tco_0454640, partial [Tanacetum coccineum]
MHGVTINHGFLVSGGRKNNHRKKTNTDTGTSSISKSDEILSDATPCVDVAKMIVSPFVVDETVATKKLNHVGLNSMLENGPWFIHNNPLILKKWHSDVNLLKEDVGTSLMLDSYTSNMYMQSWGRPSYARAMIELRAEVELKDNIVVAMPKITWERYYTCNIHVEYEWKPPRCACCK